MGWAQRLGVLTLFLGLFAAQAPGAVTTGTRYYVWGPLRYRLSVPEGRPLEGLVVALHGCKLDAASLARLTRLDAAAGARGLAVLYPEQERWRNLDNCWNWFLPWDQARGGETALVADLARDVAASLGTSDLFVTGISSGAALAAAVASCYTERFRAVALHSGLAFRAGRDLYEGQTAATEGVTYDPVLAARDAVHCSGLARGRMPALFLQGDRDTRVHPRNADQALVQFAALNALLGAGSEGLIPPRPHHAAHAVAPGGLAYDTRDYGPRGRLLLRKVVVRGMAHAWSGAPAGLLFADPRGPDATKIILDFFSRFARTEDE